MAKNLKSEEVINMISKKITLKKELRTAKKESDEKTVTKLSEKIDKIEDKLHSTPLSKT
jgi:hypothetical protein